jgi:hypothetical protein
MPPTIRADGRTLRPMYAYVTKTPKESKGDWDYIKITGKIEAAKTSRRRCRKASLPARSRSDLNAPGGRFRPAPERAP